MPLQFTLRYKDRLTDVDDVSGDRSWQPGMGRLLIETVFDTPGARIPYGLDIGYRPLIVEAWIDADGELKASKGGDVGVRLDANDPAFNLKRLQYRVTAPDGLTDALGRWTPWTPVHFDAPSTDTVRYLKNYLPRPGQRFGRGPDAWNIALTQFNGDGNLLLTLEDGKTLPPIVIPDGVLVFVDNNDGTITVGP